VVGLGYTNDSGPTLTHQIVAAIVSDVFWFGMLGLGFQPTNFTGYGNPQGSFSDTLYTNGSISSMSWSYTAGAFYRLKSIFGSLIFGGYDASRFAPNDVVFTMTEDNLRDIVLTVRSISATTPSGNTSLMSTPEFVFIDSIVPELWLPVEVCEAFEKTFGISLDNTTGTYLVNSSTHESLLSMNPNITFTLGNQKSGGPTVDIVFPYAAFDLNVSAPLLPNSTSLYFPLMRATDESQYTLGRTFLQEAYVTANYNSRTFNVSQCIFDDTLLANVIAIPSSNPTTTSIATSTPKPSSGSHSGKVLGAGAIAGIIIGALVILFFFAGILFCYFRHLLCFKKREARRSTPVHEIDSGRRIEHKSAYAQQVSGYTFEVSGQDAKVEIQGNPIMHPQELEAEVPVTHASRRLSAGRGSSAGPIDILSTIGKGKTPLTEFEERHRGSSEVLEEEIVSSATDAGTMGSILGQTRPHSPTVSSEVTWSPSSAMQRRGSRFEERLDSD